jgi:prepilin-type N-terminal cleavage/methylation domain-containing protein
VRDARGFTLVELLIVVAIIGVLASIAMAGYRYSRIRGDEAAVVAALDAINQAQFAFFQTCGNQRFAPTLASLGTPVPGGSPFLSPDLTQGDRIAKSGYFVQMAGTEELDPSVATCIGVTPVSGYQVTADPTVPGMSGMKFFATNADRVIYQDSTTFTGGMPETGPPPHGTEIK